MRRHASGSAQVNKFKEEKKHKNLTKNKNSKYVKFWNLFKTVIQSNFYSMVNFGTKENCLGKTDDCLQN